MGNIYKFGFGAADGDASQKDLLGGKGANLAEMAKLGLPIPPGVTIPTSECVTYYATDENARQLQVAALTQQVIKYLADEIKPKFGYMPLVSARSGARVSMPGMMDTILNVGLTAINIGEWAQRIGERAAYDSFRRLYEMFGSTVCGIPKQKFEEARFAKFGHKKDSEFDVVELKQLVKLFDEVVFADAGHVMPLTLDSQIYGAIDAVFKSWNSERAVEYRKLHNYSNDWGTAVTVQSMVFGNMNDQSGSGVLFTREPSTGSNMVVGEFLANAQGEDVVAGTRTPLKLEDMKKWNEGVFHQLVMLSKKMETHYRDMQDMEFTVQNGELFILQTRNGKRSARAAFRIAYDMVNEGMISEFEAVKRVTGAQYVTLQKVVIDPAFKTAPDLTGLGASAGIVQGVACFNKEQIIAANGKGILIRKETDPDDFPAMVKSLGILTATGGSTSHAAVVARGMDKPCVVGCTDLVIGPNEHGAICGKIDIEHGTQVTLDGATGRVWFATEVPVIYPTIEDHVNTVIEWAMKVKEVFVRVDPTPGKEHSMLLTAGNVVIGIRGYETAEELKALFAYLAEHRNLKGVLTTQPKKTLLGEDSTFLNFMYEDGAPSNAPMTKEFYAKLIKAASNKLWSDKFKARFSFKLDPLAEQVGGKKYPGLRQSGWSKVNEIATIGELLNAEGFVEIRESLQKVLRDQKTDVVQFVAVLRKAGKTIRMVEDGMEREQLVFAILGK